MPIFCIARSYLALDVGAEDQLRVGVAMQPAVLLDLVLELARRPAGVAEREDRARGPSPRAIALRMSSVAVRQMPSSIGRVEFSMKKSARVQHEAAPGLDRAALEHLHGAGARRQLDHLGSPE